jgi:PAS domain S-box-containing protein
MTRSNGARAEERTARRWTLARQGLLIVGVAAVFQLLLMLSIFAIERAHDHESEAALRRVRVIASADRLRVLLVDAETAMRGYLVTENSDFLETHERAVQEIPRRIAGLRALAQAGHHSTHLDEIATRTASALAFQTENRDLIRSGQRNRALDRVRNGLGKARMDAFRASMQRFLADEQRAAASDEQRSLRLRRRLNTALVMGTTANIVICIGLILFFSRKFSRRVTMVIENTHRLERRQTLPPPLEGDDEIGGLDRRIHEMATALEEADELWRRAEDNLDRFFTVSLELLCIAGFDGYFKRLNPAWEKTLGYSIRELYSHPWLDFVHPDDRQGTIAEGQRLVEGALTIRFENRYRCADGSYRWLQWNAVPHPESNLIYAAATDITERKRIEQALKDRNAALEAANRDLESFSYSVSHDLRAPLRAVDGYARILEEDYAEAIGGGGHRLVAVIRSEAHRMAALMDDLLAFSRLGRQSLAPTAVDLQELSVAIMCEVQAAHPERIIEFECEGIPPALADRTTISQVLINLLSNAVKYAKPEGKVRVAFGGRRDGDQNVYWIRDEGIGFDRRYNEKIFGVFQRLHDGDQFEGTGVGLAIVERIITRHGGRVWAEGEPGKGATFFFTLPRVEEVSEMTHARS